MAYRTYPVNAEVHKQVEKAVAASHTLRVGWAFEALCALTLIAYFLHIF